MPDSVPFPCIQQPCIQLQCVFEVYVYMCTCMYLVVFCDHGPLNFFVVFCGHAPLSFCLFSLTVGIWDFDHFLWLWTFDSLADFSQHVQFWIIIGTSTLRLSWLDTCSGVSVFLLCTCPYKPTTQIWSLFVFWKIIDNCGYPLRWTHVAKNDLFTLLLHVQKHSHLYLKINLEKCPPTVVTC